MARPGFTMTLPFGRMHLHQAWQTSHAKTSTCTISILVWCHSPSHQLHLLHSLTQAACHPTSADHKVIASVTGPSVNASTVTAVINVKGTTPTSTAPFVPPNHMSSTPKRLPHLGTNASSIEVVYRSPKATGHSITGAFQQDLVSPFRVTLTSADKLQEELCFHPNQRRVDFVISGTTGGFFSWLWSFGSIIEVYDPEHAISSTSPCRDWSLSLHRTSERSCSWPLCYISNSKPSC